MKIHYYLVFTTMLYIAHRHWAYAKVVNISINKYFNNQCIRMYNTINSYLNSDFNIILKNIILLDYRLDRPTFFLLPVNC